MSDEPKRRIRLGFIGCGGHASGTLFPSLMQVDEIEWAAVCDLNEARLNKAADKWRVPARYRDYKVMLEREELDAVAVVAQPWDMPALAIDVLERGFPLFMEKPPAISVQVAAQLAEAARKAAKPAMMATHWRHAPAYARARQIIAHDDFGAPILLEGRFHAPGPVKGNADQGIDAPWLFLLFQGVHLIDSTRSLCGDIQSVSARLNGDAKAFRSLAVSLTFQSGAVGLLSMASNSAVFTNSHRVVSAKGATVMIENQRELTSIGVPHWTGDRPGYRSYITRTWSAGINDFYCRAPGYVEELRHFAQCLLKGEQPRANLDDGLAALQTLQAIYDSAEQGGAPVAV